MFTERTTHPWFSVHLYTRSWSDVYIHSSCVWISWWERSSKRKLLTSNSCFLKTLKIWCCKIMPTCEKRNTPKQLKDYLKPRCPSWVCNLTTTVSFMDSVPHCEQKHSVENGFLPASQACHPAQKQILPPFSTLVYIHPSVSSICVYPVLHIRCAHK